MSDPYRLMYASLENGTWSAEEEVARFSIETQGMVRPDSSGRLHVTKAGTLFFTGIQHLTRTASGWSAPVSIPTQPGGRWIWPDYAGGVHFYGDLSFPPKVHYSYWVDGHFQVEDQQFDGELGGWSSQIDAQNNLYLFQRDQVPVPGGTVYGIYQRCLSNTLTWSEERVLSGQTDNLSPVVAAEDGRSRVALAWQEKTGKVVQVRLFEGCGVIHATNFSMPAEYDWELKSVTLSQDPDVFCLLARRMYSSTDFWVRCGGISD